MENWSHFHWVSRKIIPPTVPRENYRSQVRPLVNQIDHGINDYLRHWLRWHLSSPNTHTTDDLITHKNTKRSNYFACMPPDTDPMSAVNACTINPFLSLLILFRNMIIKSISEIETKINHRSPLVTPANNSTMIVLSLEGKSFFSPINERHQLSQWRWESITRSTTTDLPCG